MFNFKTDDDDDNNGEDGYLYWHYDYDCIKSKAIYKVCFSGTCATSLREAEWGGACQIQTTHEIKSSRRHFYFGTEACAKWKRWNPRNVDQSLICMLSVIKLRDPSTPERDELSEKLRRAFEPPRPFFMYSYCIFLTKWYQIWPNCEQNLWHKIAVSKTKRMQWNF